MWATYDARPLGLKGQGSKRWVSTDVDSAGLLVTFPAVRINDRRRFHPDGGPRDAEPEAHPPAAAEAAPDLGRQSEELEALRTELSTAQARVNELARGLQDSVREREAFKQRLARENERLRDVEQGDNARLVIEAIDALDLALRAADASPLARGVRLIRDDLVTKLSAQGIERLRLTGEQFDPNQAEAMDAELVTDPAADGKVLAEVRAGYALKGRVVRPAQVRVGRYVRPAQA